MQMDTTNDIDDNTKWKEGSGVQGRIEAHRPIGRAIGRLTGRFTGRFTGAFGGVTGAFGAPAGVEGGAGGGGGVGDSGPFEPSSAADSDSESLVDNIPDRRGMSFLICRRRGSSGGRRPSRPRFCG